MRLVEQSSLSVRQTLYHLNIRTFVSFNWLKRYDEGDLDAHPSQNVVKIKETNRHSIKDILEESLEHEPHALSLYKRPLDNIADRSIWKSMHAD